MELHISVRSSDPNVASEIAQMKIEGVTVKQSLVIKEIINPPVDFVLGIAVTVGVNVAAQLIARKLWEILKNKKETELAIGGQQVQINIQVIEQQIINALKEEKKSCRDCAYLHETGMVLGPKADFSLRGVGHTIGEPVAIGYSSCKQNSPVFNEKDIISNSCEKFMRKKKGMTLEQQVQEQKQHKRKATPQSIKNKVWVRSKGKCERCRKSLKNVTPHFHHKNGNPQNNKLSNMQVLCPNCHSNTKTYKKTKSRKS